jgi:hypothetical protein
VTLSRLRYICRRNQCVHKMKEGRRETGEVSLITKYCSRDVRVSAVAELPYERDSMLALLQSIHTGSVTRPTCYSICTRRHFTGGKEAAASGRPLTSPHSLIEVNNAGSCRRFSLRFHGCSWPTIGTVLLLSKLYT